VKSACETHLTAETAEGCHVSRRRHSLFPSCWFQISVNQI
jgi:hypothetical protein